MIKHIFVESDDKVSEFIGTKLDYECDLLKINDKKVTNFLKKYSEYIYSNKCEKLKEFYQLTGLIVTHECQLFNDSCNRSIVYSMNNVFDTQSNSNWFKTRIYTTNIYVVSDYDTNNYEYRHEMYKKNKIDLKLGNEIRYNLSCICNSINSKISHIENNYDKDAFNNIDKKNVKQIELTLLNNLCILLRDGTLYLDGKVYAKNVDTIWHQDSYTLYIIYKDNSFEFLTSKFPNCHRIKHKKIVYNNTVLASLYKKNAYITLLTDMIDTSIMTTFMGVDDIKCTRNSLYLIIGNRRLRIPTWYNTIIVRQN